MRSWRKIAADKGALRRKKKRLQFAALWRVHQRRLERAESKNCATIFNPAVKRRERAAASCFLLPRQWVRAGARRPAREIKLINFTYSRIKRGVHALIYSRRRRAPSRPRLSLALCVRHCKVQGIQPAIYLQPRLNLIKRELLFLEAEISHVLLSPLVTNAPHCLLFFWEFLRFECVYMLRAVEIFVLVHYQKSWKAVKSDYEPRCGFGIKMVSKSLALVFVSTDFSLLSWIYGLRIKRENVTLKVGVNYFTCNFTVLYLSCNFIKTLHGIIFDPGPNERLIILIAVYSQLD